MVKFENRYPQKDSMEGGNTSIHITGIKDVRARLVVEVACTSKPAHIATMISSIAYNTVLYILGIAQIRPRACYLSIANCRARARTDIARVGYGGVTPSQTQTLKLRKRCAMVSNIAKYQICIQT